MKQRGRLVIAVAIVAIGVAAWPRHRVAVDGDTSAGLNLETPGRRR